MVIDIYGADNLVKFIEATNLSKFSIERPGQSGSYIPLFEMVNGNTNKDAVSEFKRLVDILNPSVPYKITLFDFAEVLEDENGSPKIRKSKNKAGKMQAIFLLSEQRAAAAQQQINGTIAPAFDLAALKSEIAAEIAKKQEENEILKEIKEMRAKLAELDEEETEEDESEIGGNKTDMSQLMGFIAMLQGMNKPAHINGDVNEKSVFTENINKAVRTLYKYDKELDKDLLKLASIAENNTDMFNMLISSLRSM